MSDFNKEEKEMILYSIRLAQDNFNIFDESWDTYESIRKKCLEE